MTFTWCDLVAILLWTGAVYFAVGAWRASRSPEFRRDLERLRENRRRREAARRK